MKTTCYKCGREIEGTRAIGLWPVCPECESLDVLKDISKNNHGSNNSSGGGGGYSWINNQKVGEFLSAMTWQKIKYDFMPPWSRHIVSDDRRFNTGMLCLFFGSFGAHLFYMKRWLPVAIILLMLAGISGSILSFTPFPFFALFSIVYFSMDDETFRTRCLPKEETANFYKAKLCLYNLVKFGQKIPDNPPKTFADCVMTNKEILNCKSVLDDFMAEDYFGQEVIYFNECENSSGISYQESLLEEVMDKFPYIKSECQNAINKIHFTGSFVEWKRIIRS